MEIIKKSAIFSPCETYRYSLTRIWNHKKKPILFIGLNPSTADENNDDPTIRKCMHYVYQWGFGGLIMVNLFAFRATLPNDLKKSKFPVGKNNNQFIINAAQKSEMTIVAWGNDGQLYGRDNEVLELISNPMCINTNKTGQPAHPLYQKNDATPKSYINKYSLLKLS